MDIAEFKIIHLEEIQDWKANNTNGRKDWHERYGSLLDRSAQMRSKLLSGVKLDIDNEEHYSILYELIYKKRNDIADADAGNIGKVNFEHLIQQPDALDAIAAVIMNPNGKTGEIFHNVLLEYYEKNYWVVSNRFISACTDEVSTTAVNYNEFSKVFKLFIDNGIIEEKKSYGNGTSGTSMWYDKNVYLMKELYDIFEEEIENKETDKLFVSMHVWQIFDFCIRGDKEFAPSDNKKNGNDRQARRYGGYGVRGNTTRLVRTFAGSGSTYALQFGDTDVWKIGRSKDVERRTREINNHVPYLEFDWCPEWIPVLEEKWESEKKAHKMEQAVLDILDDKGKWTTGERVRCTREELEQAWNEAKEKIQNEE